MLVPKKIENEDDDDLGRQRIQDCAGERRRTEDFWIAKRRPSSHQRRILRTPAKGQTTKTSSASVTSVASVRDTSPSVLSGQSAV